MSGFIITTMSYKVQRALNNHQATIKGLLELVEVLQDVDEDDLSNSDNEWTITDEDGNKITLNYSHQSHELTVTKKGLKLTLNIKSQPVKVKRIMRVVLKEKS